MNPAGPSWPQLTPNLDSGARSERATVFAGIAHVNFTGAYMNESGTGRTIGGRRAACRLQRTKVLFGKGPGGFAKMWHSGEWPLTTQCHLPTVGWWL